MSRPPGGAETGVVELGGEGDQPVVGESNRTWAGRRRMNRFARTYRRDVVSASMLLGMLVAGSGCATVAREPRLTAPQRQANVESFDQIWTTIRDRHWDPQLGGIDWEGVRDELRPRVDAAVRMSEARAAMEEMIARLGQSHFAVIAGEVYADLDTPAGEGRRDGDAGLTVRVIEGHALVTEVQEESPAAQAGICPGWEVLSIGDFDVASRMKKASATLEYLPGKDAKLALAVTSRLTGPVGKTIRASFLDGKDREVEVALTLDPRRGKKTRFGHFPDMYVWTEVERLAGDIGYIAFSLFMDPSRVMPIFNEAMMSFMNAKGIVIDLRGNLGGIGPMAMGMAGWLIDEESRYLGTMYMRENELKFIVNPRPVTYSGPVAILVDGLSASTSEIMVGGLRDLGRVRVFGSRTAGMALPSVAEKLPNGDGFQYAYANYVSAGGEELEGLGVIPDVEVIPTRAALLRGEDPALMAAVAWIQGEDQESNSADVH